MHIERKAGHGFGKPVNKLIQDYALMLAFVEQALSGKLT
jgi:hypothetical protein